AVCRKQRGARARSAGQVRFRDQGPAARTSCSVYEGERRQIQLLSKPGTEAHLRCLGPCMTVQPNLHNPLKSTGKMTWKGFGRREVTLALACAAAAILLRLLSPYFLTVQNLTTVLRNSIELLLVSLGMSFVLATAGIDIAVGGALGICAIFVGWSLQGGWPVAAVLLTGPVIGATLGLVSSALIVWGKIPPIIAT